MLSPTQISSARTDKERQFLSGLLGFFGFRLFSLCCFFGVYFFIETTIAKLQRSVEPICGLREYLVELSFLHNSSQRWGRWGNGPLPQLLKFAAFFLSFFS